VVSHGLNTKNGTIPHVGQEKENKAEEI